MIACCKCVVGASSLGVAFATGSKQRQSRERWGFQREACCCRRQKVKGVVDLQDN